MPESFLQAGESREISVVVPFYNEHDNEVIASAPERSPCAPGLPEEARENRRKETSPRVGARKILLGKG